MPTYPMPMTVILKTIRQHASEFCNDDEVEPISVKRIANECDSLSDSNLYIPNKAIREMLERQREWRL